MKTFLHSGGAGDIIYSLPTIKALGGGILYIKSKNKFNKNINIFKSIKPLLKTQSYITEVLEYPDEYDFFEYDPDIHIDYDLDLFRKQPQLNLIPLIVQYSTAFDVEINWKTPWLEHASCEKMFTNFVVVNRTLRYHNDGVDWDNVMKGIKESIIFLGLQEEYDAFMKIVKRKDIIFVKTKNLKTVANYIYECSTLYCNQSVCLTIAQGFGKPYVLEVAPGHTNCIMYTPNERLLNGI